MAEPDLPPPVPNSGGAPAATAPLPHRHPAPLAFVALVIAASLTLLYLIVKVVGVSMISDIDSGTPSAIALVLGVCGLLAILPALAVVIMGHLALRSRGDREVPGRALAGAALGLGYFHLLMWGNRVLLALLIGAQTGDVGTFVTDVFWWA